MGKGLRLAWTLAAMAVLLAGCGPVPAPGRVGRPLGQPIELSHIRMVDATHGWALGSGQSILRTVDGGTQWRKVSPPGGLGVGLLQAHFLSATVGWAAVRSGSSVTVYRTLDGGMKWQAGETIPLPPPNYVVNFGFVDRRDGWLTVANYGMLFDGASLFRTANGGMHWSRVQSVLLGMPASRHPGSPAFLPPGSPPGGILDFRDPAVGWASNSAGAERGSLFMTRDGGKTWRQQTVPVPFKLRGHHLYYGAPRFLSVRDGILPVVYGVNGRTAVVVYATQDGGDTWRATDPVYGHSGSGLAEVSFIDERNGWVMLGGRLYTTDQGGQSWTKLTPGPQLKGVTVTQLDFVNREVGWLLGWTPSPRPGVGAPMHLFQTEDGGRTWVQVMPHLVPGGGTP